MKRTPWILCAGLMTTSAAVAEVTSAAGDTAQPAGIVELSTPPAADVSAQASDAPTKVDQSDLAPIEEENAVADLEALNREAANLAKWKDMDRATLEYAARWVEWQRGAETLRQREAWKNMDQSKLAAEPTAPSASLLEEYFREEAFRAAEEERLAMEQQRYAAEEQNARAEAIFLERQARSAGYSTISQRQVDLYNQQTEFRHDYRIKYRIEHGLHPLDGLPGYAVGPATTDIVW